MKNIAYLFVFGFAMLLTVSCNSDDDSGSANALVGIWRGTESDEGFELTVNSYLQR